MVYNCHIYIVQYGKVYRKMANCYELGKLSKFSELTAF